MLDIVNPEDEAGVLHDHEHGEEEEGEEDEEDETDEQYEARLAEAKEKFKKERQEANEKKNKGVFKMLFRSKGFIWLSNRPNLFFEWSQAAINGNLGVGGPWVCTLKEEPAEEGDIGDRSQNLIFIGQQMKEYKDLMIEELDRCLVTPEEWAEIVKNNLTQKIENDPFKESMYPEDVQEC